jgi:hypothetical protein
VGCPEPLAQQALVDAAINFCEVTQTVVTDLDPVNVRAGVRNYELDLPSQSQLSQISRVWYKGRRLGAVPAIDANDVEALSGEPVYYYSTSVDELLVLTLYPMPAEDAAGELQVRATTKPTRSATSLPNVLYNRWAETIVNAALERLHSMPGMAFTDPAKAAVLQARLRHEMYVARVDAMRGGIVSSLTVTKRPFA